jgi:type II secretory pathway component GspD/PulD (secretin)
MNKGRQGVVRQGVVRQGVVGQDVVGQDVGRQDVVGQDVGRQDVGRQDVVTGFSPSLDGLKPVATFLFALILALPMFGSVSVKRSEEKSGTLTVNIVDAPLSEAVAALQFYLPLGVEQRTNGDPQVTLKVKNALPEGVLRALALAAHVDFAASADQYTLTDHDEVTVTLDVKDAEVRVILKSMQQQCGIKNLIVDPNVTGTGTFLFHDVPCRTAFDTVLRSLGLTSAEYSNSVVTVGSEKH